MVWFEPMHFVPLFLSIWKGVNELFFYNGQMNVWMSESGWISGLNVVMRPPQRTTTTNFLIISFSTFFVTLDKRLNVPFAWYPPPKRLPHDCSAILDVIWIYSMSCQECWITRCFGFLFSCCWLCDRQRPCITFNLLVFIWSCEMYKIWSSGFSSIDTHDDVAALWLHCVSVALLKACTCRGLLHNWWGCNVCMKASSASSCMECEYPFTDAFWSLTLQ